MTRITKLVTLLMIFFALSASIFLPSCNNAIPPGSIVIPVPADTSALAKINHFIPQDQIRQYRTAFRVENDSLGQKSSLLLPDAEAFNKPALLQILKDPACVGIRIYHGVKRGGNRNELRVIIVGIDSQGKDIYIPGGSSLATDATPPTGGLEYGQCPTCQKQN